MPCRFLFQQSDDLADNPLRRHNHEAMRHPEELARKEIDALLGPCEWVDKNAVNLAASRGVAVLEISFKDQRAGIHALRRRQSISTIDAKPTGLPGLSDCYSLWSVH